MGFEGAQSSGPASRRREGVSGTSPILLQSAASPGFLVPLSISHWNPGHHPGGTATEPVNWVHLV